MHRGNGEYQSMPIATHLRAFKKAGEKFREIPTKKKKNQKKSVLVT
jgi:hypothetical protein